MRSGLLPTLDAGHSWLVADIGGTNARLAHLHRDGTIAQRRTLANDAFADLDELLDAYRNELRGELGTPPSRLLLALALPVGGDADTALVFTNRPWRVCASGLARRFALDHVAIVNDFVAAAAGSVAPHAAPATVLRAGVPHLGARVVLGPGTGLGVAGVLDPAEGTPGAHGVARIVDSEAGHMTFAACDDDSQRVLRAAQARWGRVSWERILCGGGLAWLDAFWRGSDRAEPPAQVVARARGGDADALAAIGWFTSALGTFAGDVCLALRAFGGVTLTGGVLAHLAGLFDRERFLASFVAKGRFAAALSDVPCAHAEVDALALAGLSNIVHGRVRVPGVCAAGAHGQAVAAVAVADAGRHTPGTDG
jgi:glucokinase